MVVFPLLVRARALRRTPRARRGFRFRRRRVVRPPRLRFAARCRTISANLLRAAICAAEGGFELRRRMVFFLREVRSAERKALRSPLVSARARFWRCRGVSPRISARAERALRNAPRPLMAAIAVTPGFAFRRRFAVRAGRA